MRRGGKTVLALLFVTAGVLHFVAPGPFLSVMPPYVPRPLFWVYASGVAEIVLGLMLLHPKTQGAAAWGLALLLVAVFPANLHMALNAQRFPDIPPALLWLRLPLQAALIAWALRYR